VANKGLAAIVEETKLENGNWKLENRCAGGHTPYAMENVRKRLRELRLPAILRVEARNKQAVA
jgi:hypothetical protein